MNQNVCRYCLKENPPQTYKIFDNYNNLWEDLRVCLPASLKCEHNDGLPQIICAACWLLVQQFKDFRKQCMLADQELKNRYADYKNQAVEEVLGLIEKLRQEDNNMINKWQGKEICHFYEESQSFGDFDNSEISHLFSDFDLYSSSHDSGIFEEDFSQQNSYNFENFLQTTANQNNCSDQSSASTKSSESDTSSRRKSYKGPFPCNHCDKKFTRNFQLKLHLISVHQIGDGLQYTCKMCSKTFASNHSLSYHQKSVHYQQKPHFCPQCDRQFVLKSQLVSHMRIHTGETKPRIFECQECGKKWPTRSDLRTHMRSHDPNMERPFKCDRCEKSFFTRGHLTSHQLVHTGEKPFACEFCNRSYQSVGNLNNHMARRHMKEIEHTEQKSLEDYRLDNDGTPAEMVLMEL
ncbi:zinc finger protein 32 [Calliphora vicina]|uniref:zinc finger protein 32 n=1 Tax=Calliphora vicina TaxID=7373 RepID=UPI00325B04D4